MSVHPNLVEIGEPLSLRTTPTELIIRLEPGTMPDRIDDLLDLLRHALVDLRADVPYR